MLLINRQHDTSVWRCVEHASIEGIPASMAVLTMRSLTAALMAAAITLHGAPSTQAAVPDSEVSVNVTNSSSDRVLSFPATPPNGFAAVSFNDTRWSRVSLSPCSDPTWFVPEGAQVWEWAGTCSPADANVVIRRSFVVPALTALTARLWISVHGGGLAYLNGQAVAESFGDPVLVDVTALLRANGARNVLTFVATQTESVAVGVTYSLQLSLSRSQFNAYLRTHPSYGNGNPLPGATGATFYGQGTRRAVAPAAGQSACITDPPAGIVPIYTAGSGSKPFTDGWVRQITGQSVYVVTRLLDTGSIGGPSDMPSVQVNGQPVHATAIAYDDSTGEQVLVFPASTNLTPLGIGDPHNQPIGQVAQVMAYSRTQSCTAGYSAQVVQYILKPDGRRLAQIDTVPNDDGADGGVAFDASGNFLGTITFDATIVDAQGRIAPSILSPSNVIDSVDALGLVLTNQRAPLSTQHVLSVVTNANGSQGVVNGTGSPSPTPVPAH